MKATLSNSSINKKTREKKKQNNKTMSRKNKMIIKLKLLINHK